MTMESVGPRRLRRSYGQDVRLRYGPHVRALECHEGLGGARRPDELDLQTAIVVNLNDRSDVARSQAVRGDVVNEDDCIEGSECHDDLGKTVTSLTNDFPGSSIQTVSIAAVPIRPFNSQVYGRADPGDPDRHV